MNLIMTIILPFFFPVNSFLPVKLPFALSTQVPVIAGSYSTVGEISCPDHFQRIPDTRGSFGWWLGNIPLKADGRVYLYDGRLKKNQQAQFAVLDISVGKMDLQQCADAVMRLRAEYLFSVGRFSDIHFEDNNGHSYRLGNQRSRQSFDHYLERVFSWCGTASLEKQLHPVKRIAEVRPGDVLIKGGFPGHAEIVMDVAINPEGEKAFLLAQSYMPAQDIHILKNTRNKPASPWYLAAECEEMIYTPEWTFTPGRLRRW